MSRPFVHLHVHSEYSLVDSVVRLPALAESAAASGMPAVALTDHMNLFGMVKFYHAAVSRGIKPIVGAEVLVSEADRGSGPARLVLLCLNATGYRSLSRLLTRAYLERDAGGVPALREEWLTSEALAGLAGLCGGVGGWIGRALLAKTRRGAGARLGRIRDQFAGNFYLELQRTGRPDEARFIDEALELGARHGVPAVATNDVRFISPDDFEAHEARVCIQQGRVLADPTRPRDYTPEQHLRSPEAMAELFSDLPEALDNAVTLAKRCNLTLELGQAHLPDFSTPAGESPAEYLRGLAARGLAERLQNGVLRSATQEAYRERLEQELDVICRMGFAGYFLIVADFIGWAKQAGIPVGPGRGSGAGSLVAFTLGITDLDPLRYDLLFERFLNPERVSMPDFDIDFCMEGRDRVIDYVADRYGRDRVSQIITYGTMAARAVVRDVGRVLGQPYGFVDRVAKLIPNEPGVAMTLDKAVSQEAELRALVESDDDVRGIVELAQQLEGLVRNAGKHAGGLVIAPAAITDFTPLYQVEGEKGTVTQFDKDDVEAIGLVKFDFLGLRTLTIIDRAVRAIDAAAAQAGTPRLSVPDLPLDDGPTFDLLRACRTTAVFQLESRGMRDLIKRLQPDSFDDIVALVALFRPGPLQSGMVDDFISRKHGGGEQPIDYLHPDLEPVLKSTYGVILYQEQVMQIAQRLAGYTLGEADLLRRAMGKKKPEEMAKQRSGFVAGAEARGTSEAQASRIFDLMEKFAGYGFNKSHSAAYALLAYQTAYLKANYPPAFMAAVLTSEMSDTDQLRVLKRECEAMQIDLRPPDVNVSEYEFAVESGSAIRYGLGAIKGLGRAAVEAICAARSEGGRFQHLFEFCARSGGARLGRRAMEALVKSGALDSFGPNRASLLAAVPAALLYAEQTHQALSAGQEDLFGEGDHGMRSPEPIPTLPDWGWGRRLEAERESLGLYLSGHPFEQYLGDQPFLCTATLAGLAAEPPPRDVRAAAREVTVAGLVAGVRKRGARVSLDLDDGSAILEVGLFAEAYDRFRHLLSAHSIVSITGTLRYDEFIDGWRLAAREVVDLDRVVEGRATGLVLRWSREAPQGPTISRLREALERFRPGRCAVTLVYEADGVQGRLRFGPDWTVRPTRELRESLSELVGVQGFRFVYERAPTQS